MSKKIFRSIWMVSILVLTASLIIIMAALYDYVDTTQREQLVDETHLAAKGVELNGKKYLHKLDSDSYRITWVAADGTVLFDNRADADSMGNHKGRAEIKEAEKDGFRPKRSLLQHPFRKTTLRRGAPVRQERAPGVHRPGTGVDGASGHRPIHRICSNIRHPHFPVAGFPAFLENRGADQQAEPG